MCNSGRLEKRATEMQTRIVRVSLLLLMMCDSWQWNLLFPRICVDDCLTFYFVIWCSERLLRVRVHRFFSDDI